MAFDQVSVYHDLPKLTNKIHNKYAVKYKTLMKDIRENPNKWRAMPHTQIGKLNIKIYINSNKIDP